jgi:hypothetical protein
VVTSNKESVLIGIDFGTTKTSATYCLVGGHDVQLFKTIPTRMIFPPESKPKDWNVPETKGFMPPPGSTVLDGFKMEIDNTEVVYENWRNADIAGKFLSELRKQLEQRFQIDGLTITVPAEWSISKRQATLYAAHLANFRCPIALLEEPLAAFLRFYDISKDLVQKYQRVLVFDFGGGTCDISLIDLNHAKPKVRKSTTLYIGGSDIDNLIVQWWLNKAELRYGDIKENTPLDFSTLKYKAKERKEILSDEVAARRSRDYEFSLSDSVVKDKYEFRELERPEISLEISAQKLQELVEDGLDIPRKFIEVPGITNRIEQELKDFLREHDSKHQVGCVILSGGTCNLWVIQDFLERFFLKNYEMVEFIPKLETLNDPTSNKRISIGESVGRGSALHQYYLTQDNQVAIPSLNYPLEVVVKCENRELQRIQFDEGISLPVSKLDMLKRKAGYVHPPGVRDKNFEILIEHDGKEMGFGAIPTNNLSRISQLAWTCSVNEYGLVQFKVYIISIGLLKPLREKFFLYPVVREFAVDKIDLFKKQQALHIYGGQYDS